ncbi:YT521-B-like domain-containing protein [Multifurca ochricompacta]|uniref:YT521-B-like domain-containing protein n=1 Tax=Multifurca ochricompacta TaxID=376703 RepID=A0AAD4LYP8_9AGAM|nr:YT521-B-like domain-containing protein [Multifurca ochricompacta]
MNGPQVYGGVSSIFLIARSNCAFLNFQSEDQRDAAIARFHGQSIRPDDLRCPRLVCRIRRRTDDLMAGVGAQRGNAMHVKWIKEQKSKATRGKDEVPYSLDDIERPSSPLSILDDDSQGTGQGSFTTRSNRSGSFASTDSGVLTRFFPQRYFILKSLTQYDMDLSVQSNVWATQRHNEDILDRAYRTSKDVLLIFSVNKSGEFYGYARMAGPIVQSDDNMSWEFRSSSPAPSSRVSAGSGVNANASISLPEVTCANRQNPHYFLPPKEHKVVDELPPSDALAQEGTSLVKVQACSASAELPEPHARLTQFTSIYGRSPPHMTIPLESAPFEFNADAPDLTLRDHPTKIADPLVEQFTTPVTGDREDASHPTVDTGLQPVVEEPAKEGEVPKDTSDIAWGHPFRVEWIRTERLPFYRTRHLRNPWNHDREVKVSRDGTELEPSIGQQLLEEWDRPLPSPANNTVASSRVSQRRRAARSARYPP